jgi:hypothetical protein
MRPGAEALARAGYSFLAQVLESSSSNRRGVCACHPSQLTEQDQPASTASDGRIWSHPSGTPDHSGGSYVPAALGGCGGCGLLPAPLLSSPAAAATASPLLPSPAAAAVSAAAACSFSCCCWAASTACWMALSRCPGVTVAAATAAAAAARLFAAATRRQWDGTVSPPCSVTLRPRRHRQDPEAHDDNTHLGLALGAAACCCDRRGASRSVVLLLVSVQCQCVQSRPRELQFCVFYDQQ